MPPPQGGMHRYNLARISLQASTHALASGATVRVRSVASADALRRGRDVAGSLLLLALMLPLMLMTACLIKLESRGPVLYRQDRVGMHRRVFALLNLRGMRIDADTGGPCRAAQRGHRVTRVGGFIRTCRIDELPQLVNVLRGEMSLIGPRPERPFFTDQLTLSHPLIRRADARAARNCRLGAGERPAPRLGQGARVKLNYDPYYNGTPCISSRPPRTAGPFLMDW